MSGDDFLSRWSRRKHAARRGDAVESAPRPATPEPAAVPPPVADVPSAPPQDPTGAAALPAVESLTPESDFTPFMKPEVDGDLRRDALKSLFKDPRFNVMDGLDVYIDDYSKPDPIPEGWLARMNQVARLGEWKPEPEQEGASPPAGPGTPPPPATSDSADTATGAGLEPPSERPVEAPQDPVEIQVQSARSDPPEPSPAALP